MANSNVYSNKNNKGKFSIVNQMGWALIGECVLNRGSTSHKTRDRK